MPKLHGRRLAFLALALFLVGCSCSPSLPAPSKTTYRAAQALASEPAVAKTR